MGVNWDSGVLFWQDHAPSANERYTLSHLHPFVRRIELAATGKNPARKAKLYVAFGLHTFTRAIEPGDGHHDLYRDNREARTFAALDTNDLFSCRTFRSRGTSDLPGTTVDNTQDSSFRSPVKQASLL